MVFSGRSTLAILVVMPASAGVWAAPSPPAVGIPENTSARVLSEKNEPLFSLERKVTESNGAHVSTAIYKDLDGTPNVSETARFENGTLVRIEMKRFHEDESGAAEFRDGKIHYTWTERGKTKTETEDLPENLIAGPILALFVQKHWEEIQAGKNVHARMVAIDHQMTVGFDFFKDGERSSGGKTLLDVRMKPSSPFIALVAPRLTLTFDKASKTFLAYEGRLFPRVRSGKSWKAVEGTILYSDSVTTK